MSSRLLLLVLAGVAGLVLLAWSTALAQMGADLPPATDALGVGKNPWGQPGTTKQPGAALDNNSNPDEQWANPQEAGKDAKAKASRGGVTVDMRRPAGGAGFWFALVGGLAGLVAAGALLAWVADRMSRREGRGAAQSVPPAVLAFGQQQRPARKPGGRKQPPKGRAA